MGRNSETLDVEIVSGVVVGMLPRVKSLYDLLLSNKGKALSIDYLCTELRMTPNNLRVSVCKLRTAVSSVYFVVMDRKAGTYCLRDVVPAPGV